MPAGGRKENLVKENSRRVTDMAPNGQLQPTGKSRLLVCRRLCAVRVLVCVVRGHLREQRGRWGHEMEEMAVRMKSGKVKFEGLTFLISKCY